MNRHFVAAYYGNELGNLSRHEVVQFLYALQGSICGICGKYLRRKLATIDHVIPRARGGAHDITNWMLAHARCNFAKADQMPSADQVRRHRKLAREIRFMFFRLAIQNWWERITRGLRR